MEFNEKLQELRKSKGLTQEELAEALFVSRTAVSKWESGRGYPGIDSLKAISRFFGITIDELLSGEELLSLAEEDTKQKENRFCDLAGGLLDVSVAAFLFLPLFRQSVEGALESVSLFSLTEIAPYLEAGYIAFVVGIIFWGILTLAMQGFESVFWAKIKSKVGLLLSVSGVILFVISMQPYAATLTFIFLIIKVLMLIKRQ